MSGRDVRLRIYVERHNIDHCDHAMLSLKKSIQWDEEVFGLEYDLDRYIIVAVDDFNMGAMENKGLNVFNSKYVLARSDTATDQDYAGIEGVIAHEFSHILNGDMRLNIRLMGVLHGILLIGLAGRGVLQRSEPAMETCLAVQAETGART